MVEIAVICGAVRTRHLAADIRSEYFRDAYTLTFHADRVVQGVVDALVILMAGGHRSCWPPVWSMVPSMIGVVVVIIAVAIGAGVVVRVAHEWDKN